MVEMEAAAFGMWRGEYGDAMARARQISISK